MEEREFVRRERRARVVGAWLAGTPVSEIAAEQHLEVLAVRHILVTMPELRQEHARRDAEAQKQQVARLRRRLVRWSAAHRGEPLTVAADRYGLSTRQVANLLGEQAQLHPSRRSVRARRYSDSDSLQRVREHILATGDHRTDTYRDAARVHGWPSSAVVVSRFGTWRAALKQAGTPLPADTKPPRGRVISDAEIHAWISRYFAEATSLSWNQMARWMRENGGPSANTIRQRVGVWPAVVATARRSPSTS